MLLPAEFGANTVSLNPAARAIHEIAARSGRHARSYTSAEVLDALVQRYDMEEAASYLR